MKKTTQIVSIASQKGGVGKSTITSILATSMAYEYGFKVLVLDMDKQGSLIKKRLDDLADLGIKLMKKEQNKSEEELNRDYTIKDYSGYAQEYLKESNMPVILSMPINDEYNTNITNIVEILERIKHTGEYKGRMTDIVFCDMPGAFDSNLVEILKISDSVVVPAVATDIDLKATVGFMRDVNKLKRILKEQMNKDLGVFGVLNKRKGLVEERQVEMICKENLGLPLVGNLSDLADYKRFSTIMSFTRTEGVVNRKAQKEVWSFLFELLECCGILKGDLSDYEAWNKPSLLKENVLNCYARFLEVEV